MKYKYEKKHDITYSDTDKNLKLSIVSSMNLAQDMMTKYFQTFGSDNYTTKNKDNAVWVVTKASMHFYNHPKWMEKIKCNTYVTLEKTIRLGIETIFKNGEDEIQFIVSLETCPIDLDTRKIRKINTISFPNNMESTDAIIEEPFSKLKGEFKEQDLVYKYTVKSTDIDFSKHTNNVSYVRILMNAIESSYWDEKFITDFEINYISESREKEELSIYKKEVENNEIVFLITNKEKEITRAKIKYINAS